MGEVVVEEGSEENPVEAAEVAWLDALALERMIEQQHVDDLDEPQDRNHCDHYAAYL